ncbi:MAG: GMC family oxidoreductase, partial [Acidimicrobiia bacterium]|nr:GMC family oxidoreductase [Acidimicrobiia bacterium]
STIDAVAALGEDEWFWPGIEALTDGRAELVRYRQGRGVGGGTAVNTLVMMAGDRIDYDRWASEQGCTGWDWASMAPWFEVATGTLAPAVVELGPLAAALGPLAAAAGHPLGGSTAEIDCYGYAPAALAVADGRRRSVADAYLVGVGPELVVRSGVAVRRVVTERGRATGVEVEDGTVVGAGRVVLAAGAINTPALLRRSGLGGSGAGRSVKDHPSFVFTVGLRAGFRQLVGESVAAISAVLRWRSPDRPPGGSADLAALVMDHVGLDADGRRYGAVVAVLTDPDSTGNLPHEGAPFTPGWLSTVSDRRRFRAGVRAVARLLDHPELGAAIDGVYVDDMGTPVDRLLAAGDVELDRWLLDHPGPVSHVAATCPLGSGPDAVVGLDGTMPGAQGLSVVDASVLPHLPSANPQLPVMAVAERLTARLLDEIR